MTSCKLSDVIPLRKSRGLSPKKRQQIIQAAIVEFDQYGFAGANMDRLSQQADVSKRTVYNHFPSKDDLFAAIVEESGRILSEENLNEYDQTLEHKEQLKGLLLQSVQLYQSEHFIKIARIIVAEMFHNAEKVQKMIEPLNGQFQSLTQFLSQAVSDQVLNIENIQEAEQQLSALIKGQSFWPALLQNKSALSSSDQLQLVDATVELFWARYKG